MGWEGGGWGTGGKLVGPRKKNAKRRGAPQSVLSDEGRGHDKKITCFKMIFISSD